MADEFPSTGEEATNEEKELLSQRIQELKISNAALLAENEMFERFISRLDPQDLAPQAVEGGLAGAGRVRRLRSRSSTADHLQLLTLEQKCYVAQSEVEATQQDLDKLKLRGQRIHDHYKASMEEAEIRLQEIRKAKKEFERKVVKPLKENKWKMQEPENVLRYIEDKSKATQVEMLRLKNQALVLEEKELQKKLIAKAEIEKPMSQEDMDQGPGGDDLEELQVKNFKLQHNLRKHQKKLQTLTQESEELSRDIAKKTQTLKNIEEIIQHTEEERLKAEALNRHLHQQLTEYRAPDTLDYMNLKVKQKKLQHSVSILERKAGIAKNMGTHNKIWNKVRATPTAVNSADSGSRPWEDKIQVKLPSIAKTCT